MHNFISKSIDILALVCYNKTVNRSRPNDHNMKGWYTMTAQEKYQEVFKKNIDRMMTYQALSESARKRGDIETARKYRRQYTDLKAEIDAALYPILFNKTEN